MLLAGPLLAGAGEVPEHCLPGLRILDRLRLPRHPLLEVASSGGLPALRDRLGLRLLDLLAGVPEVLEHAGLVSQHLLRDQPGKRQVVWEGGNDRWHRNAGSDGRGPLFPLDGRPDVFPSQRVPELTVVVGPALPVKGQVVRMVEGHRPGVLPELAPVLHERRCHEPLNVGLLDRDRLVLALHFRAAGEAAEHVFWLAIADKELRPELSHLIAERKHALDPEARAECVRLPAREVDRLPRGDGLLEVGVGDAAIG
mmetsp:Transcript_122542/g.357843  ORF Transcript_122542/g.357843 Transcript_122542/m.357843 type:complete len:255 (-) Transcript_122542:237-1001(-)